MDLHVRAQHPPCPYCHGPVEPRQIKAACDACMAWAHLECWDEHGACPACACPRPLVAEGLDLAGADYDAIRAALGDGNARAAQALCLELTPDEDAARRLYEALLDEGRHDGWLASARAQNERVLALLAAREVEAAQALCFELADEDEERARALYAFLLDHARDQGRVPPAPAAEAPEEA